MNQKWKNWIALNVVSIDKFKNLKISCIFVKVLFISIMCIKSGNKNA